MIPSNTIDKIDLSHAENLSEGYFSSTNDHWNQSNLIINNENLYINQDSDGDVEVSYREPEIRIASSEQKLEENYLEYVFGGSIDTENLNHSNLIEEDEEGNIIIKSTGTEQIKVVDDWGRKHPVTLTIFENNPDTTLENTGVTGKFVDGWMNWILKSNGELWNVISNTEAELIDTNVEKYASWLDEEGYETGFASILKKGKMLMVIKENSFATDKKIEKKIENVQDIENNVYLTTNGELYTLEYNYIMEKIVTKKVTTGVKKLVGDCIILNDNKTYIMGDEGLEQVADFEIIECGYVGGQPCDYLSTPDRYYRDQSGSLYSLKEEDEGYKLYKENYDGPLYDYVESRLDGNVSSLENNIYYHKIYFAADETKKIIDNVKTAFYMGDIDVLIRTDGSIWTYNDLLGLNKITKSSSQDDPTDEGNYITSPSIKEKKVGKQAAITGMKPNTTIQNFIGQNNFNTQYTVKILNENQKEASNSNLMGTGYTIQLLKNNGVVQQYIAVIYGDTTGDGQINSFDALTLIKAINNKVAFKGEAYQEAGRIMTKSGQTPTALDALAIIKSANKKYTIEQFK